MRYQEATATAAEAAERVYSAEKRASSLSRVEKPSDDPAAYVSIAGKDATLSRLSTRKDTLAGARSDLDLAESSLASAGDLLAQAKQLAIDMANGDKSADERAVAAKQVTQIRQQIVALANTKGGRGYLFSGTKADSPAIDEATGAFLGNDGVRNVEVADGVLASANVSGAQAFTKQGGADVVAVLDDFAKALAANDVTGISGAIDSMGAAHKQVVATRADVGLSADRLQSAVDVTTNAIQIVTSSRAAVAQIDPTKAYSDLANATAIFERDLAITKQILAMAASNSV
jgi:flagellar hook-associated protein 3 FlgL